VQVPFSLSRWGADTSEPNRHTRSHLAPVLAIRATAWLTSVTTCASRSLTGSHQHWPA
jgi:hypothetical protein